ncbi:hypothetical protein ASC78_13045 [Variovorax sp. Root318D1]|uniref:hypothetical protein n=1 Tax=Variovorax sp. Root318D1 TaxID=1736513 RepID=UPI0006FAD209|nr:hypothetical protein [Variovorax sp. Root318D1]KQU83568.1 hypothetical protein ASC78_13045 [Variovorax sp. Root318D1]
MRTLCFWFGIAAAFLCGWADPAWGYAVLCVLSVVQLALLRAPGASVFLLLHYATVLTYFSLAPAMQIADDVFFWDAGVIGAPAHSQALALLLLYMAGVELARLGMPEPLVKSFPTRTPTPEPQMAGVAHPLLLLLSGILAAFASLFIRPDLNFIARGDVGNEQSVPVDFIVYSTLPKLIVLMCFVALAIHALRQRTIWSWSAAGFALVLSAIAANPVNTPRQILLIGLLPLLIHLFGRGRRWTLALLLFGAIAGLGPVLNLVSRGSFWGETLTTFPYSQDFDAMFIIAGILERAPDPELGWGRYLLSAFSFFLPRDLKLYPDFDPLGWPSILGNFSQANLSLPPFTTAFFDFGLAGPVLLGLLISAGARYLDKLVDPRGVVSGSYLCALVLLAAYVPFMRGPILGWGPFAATGLMAAAFAGVLSSRFRRPRPAASPYVPRTT